MKVLLADDEESIRLTLGDELRDAGHDVTDVARGDDAIEAVDGEAFDCVICDIRMPGADGMEVLRHVRRTRPDTEVIVITGQGSLESALEATRAGAFDYLRKPFLNEEVLLLLDKVARVRDLEAENVRLRGELSGDRRPADMVGTARPMHQVFSLIDAAAQSDATVLIEGESGTGKEVAARAIHAAGERSSGPWVALSCAVYPENLLEDELFGHEPGAFTDARERKAGRFERAHGGTIFLDDIDDMTPATQVKLLRVLQEREFERLGGTETVEVDVRVIAASKANLADLVADGAFREDLYYRLAVVRIELPPLRDRREDVPLLVEHFIERYGRGRPYVVEEDTMDALRSRTWPGNVRELANAVERAIALAGSSAVLKPEHLLADASVPRSGEPDAGRAVLREDGTPAPLADAVRAAEIAHIRRALDHTGWHRTRTAELLGISRKNLWEKMRDYGIEEDA